MWDVRWRKICWHGLLRKFYNSGLHRGAKDARQQVIFRQACQTLRKILPANGLFRDKKYERGRLSGGFSGYWCAGYRRGTELADGAG